MQSISKTKNEVRSVFCSVIVHLQKFTKNNNTGFLFWTFWHQL